MDGAQGGVVFTDDNAGGNAHTWTPTGAGVITDQATVKFGLAAGLYNATAAIRTPDSADFTLGSGDFTIDCWISLLAGSGRRVITGQANSGGQTSSVSFSIEVTAANVVAALVGNGAALTTVTSTTVLGTGTFIHVAFVRTGNVLKLFVNGVQEGGDVAFAGSVLDSSNLVGVGVFGELGTLLFDGSIDEFRLSVGVARWTTNFTPPMKPYD